MFSVYMYIYILYSFKMIMCRFIYNFMWNILIWFERIYCFCTFCGLKQAYCCSKNMMSSKFKCTWTQQQAHPTQVDGGCMAVDLKWMAARAPYPMQSRLKSRLSIESLHPKNEFEHQETAPKQFLERVAHEQVRSPIVGLFGWYSICPGSCWKMLEIQFIVGQIFLNVVNPIS